ncbi:MAG: hypothetical protein GX075_14250 [Firmicutes bacterium]|nr:hypothetical protein [Bacillota bacterium]
MKRYLFILIFLLLLSGGGFHSVIAAENERDTYHAETVPLYLRTLESISSKTITEGSKIELKVVRDVYDDRNNLVIPYGAIANGMVSKTKKANYLGRTGLIEITIDSIITTAGILEMNLNYKVKGGYNIPLLLLGFLAGKDVVIPENEIIVMQLGRNSLPCLETGVRQPLESPKVEIELPVDQSVYSQKTSIQFFCNIISEQKVSTFKLYGNDDLIYEQAGTPGIIDLNKKLSKKGEYVLVAKTELEDGQVIVSDEIRIIID